MKKGIYIAVIIALVGLACFQLGRLTAPRAAETVSLNDEIEEYAGEDFEAFVSEKFTGMTLAPDLWQATDYKGQAVGLDTIGNENTIFARYSASGCRPCIDTLLGALKQKAEDNPESDIVLLIKNIPLRDLYVLGAEYGPAFRLFACEKLPIDFNSAETPVVFKTDSSVLTDHFTCRYGDHQRTINYINSL